MFFFGFICLYFSRAKRGYYSLAYQVTCKNDELLSGENVRKNGVILELFFFSLKKNISALDDGSR